MLASRCCTPLSGFTTHLACLVLLSACQASATGAPDGGADREGSPDAAEGSDGPASGARLDGSALDSEQSAGEVAPPFDLAPPVAEDGSAPTPALDGGAIRALLTRVAHYQLDHGASGNDWKTSTFYVGLMAAQRATGDDGLRQAAQKWGASHGWHLHDGPARFADNQVCTQTYLELYLAQPGNASWIASARGVFDDMVAHPRAGHVEWSWCDALFMAGPALARLGAATGGKPYFALLDDMFFDSEKALFSQADGLIWRDHHDVGSKTFWGRGNGWAIAAVARVLDVLPMDDPKRPEYQALLARLAGALAKAQGSDGAWRSDLLHPERFPNPEMSGTGLITFGIAWGVVHGVLPRAQFLPVAVRGWTSLVSHVDATGRLGYVQDEGHDPAAAQASQSFPYGVGALLLAGEQVLKL